MIKVGTLISVLGCQNIIAYVAAHALKGVDNVCMSYIMFTHVRAIMSA